MCVQRCRRPEREAVLLLETLLDFVMCNECLQFTLYYTTAACSHCSRSEYKITYTRCCCFCALLLHFAVVAIPSGMQFESRCCRRYSEIRRGFPLSPLSIANPYSDPTLLALPKSFVPYHSGFCSLLVWQYIMIYSR